MREEKELCSGLWKSSLSFALKRVKHLPSPLTPQRQFSQRGEPPHETGSPSPLFRGLALALVWLLPFTSSGFGKALATNGVNKYRASQYRELGLSYQQQERYPLAIATMKKSVELDPENITGRVNLGWAQHLARQDNAAAESLLQAVYRDPVSVPAFNALGIVYLVSGNLVGAVMTHAWAATLQPDDEIAYYNLSLAFERLRLYNSAIATAKRAATLEPHNPHPLIALAIAHWEHSDHTLAKIAYERARNLDSRYSDRTFLLQLRRAGFSQSQIQMANQVRSAST